MSSSNSNQCVKSLHGLSCNLGLWKIHWKVFSCAFEMVSCRCSMVEKVKLFKIARSITAGVGSAALLCSCSSEHSNRLASSRIDDIMLSPVRMSSSSDFWCFVAVTSATDSILSARESVLVFSDCKTSLAAWFSDSYPWDLWTLMTSILCLRKGLIS
jgi:hypothetical protein